jgi:putative transcriptional regulator
MFRAAAVTLSRFAHLGALAGVFLLSVAAAGTSAVKAARVGPELSGLTGQLLIATPRMSDPRFVRTVIYMVRHDATGAMGLVLNRPIGDAPLARLMERLGLESNGVSGNIRVHYGGPVGGAQVFVLHTAEYVRKGTVVVDNAVALTSQPEILLDIATGTGPRRTFFALGYAGWAPGQLEAEIEAGAWVTVPADEALVFDDDYEGKWQRAIARQITDL